MWVAMMTSEVGSLKQEAGTHIFALMVLLPAFSLLCALETLKAGFLLGPGRPDEELWILT
jgi:hypothetical protein